MAPLRQLDEPVHTVTSTAPPPPTPVPVVSRRAPLLPGGRSPVATYRWQLTDDAGFAAARDALDLLVDLGVSHLYLSPVLQAVPGSTHGYDATDPHHVDLGRGGEQAFTELVGRAHELGLRVLLDVVPNHLAADTRNAAWADVLRHGRASRFAAWFDVSWGCGTASVPDRLLLPVLGTGLEDAVRAGDVALVRHGGEPHLRVYDQLVPLADESVLELFSAVATTVDGGPAGRRFAALVADPGTGRDDRMVDDHRRTCVLGAMVDDHPVLASALDRLLASASADPATLAWVLDRQHYELAHWHETARRLDRRRFFDVADLVGVRQEDPEVFRATHARVLGLCWAGQVDGLRIDHPDGLVDPGDYLERLRVEIGDRWLVVEKILSGDEELPEGWPVHGTTGYERSASIDRLFVDPAGERPLTDLVRSVAPGEPTDVDEVVERAKRDVLRDLFEPELRRLAALAARVLGRVAAADPSAVDRTAAGSADAGCDDVDVRALVTELVVAAPVYRTYVRRGRAACEADRAVLDRIWERAAERWAGVAEGPVADAPCRPEVLRAVFDRGVSDRVAPDRVARTETEEAFVVRFQQLTAALTAKGVEDTAFYRLARLAALCEVGADPAEWSVSPDEFHRRQLRWVQRWPAGMVATSTHDSKRSLDARARLVAISEVPDLWRQAVEGVARRLDHLVGSDHRDPLVELLLVQTAVALHPVDADRLAAAARKIAREAKRATSWLRPDDDAEAQVDRVARALADDEGCRRALAPLLDHVVPAGRVNSTAMVLTAALAGGVPDLYQGSLGWRLAAADPDNRAPVDHRAERALLVASVTEGASRWREGSVGDDERGVTKAHVVRTALAVRREHEDACAAVPEPIRASGAAAGHVLAWATGSASEGPAVPEVPEVPEVMVVVARLGTALGRRGGWGDTSIELPPGSWRDRLLGAEATAQSGVVALVDLLGARPGALLVRDLP